MKTQSNTMCKAATERRSADPPRRRFARILFFAFIAVALSATTGCSLLEREEDGNQEPNVGEYRVTISPTASAVDLNQAGLVKIPVTLNVVCAGPYPPADCSTHNPDWYGTLNADRGGYLVIEIADKSKPSTTATVTVDPAGYLARYSWLDSSAKANFVEHIYFEPGSVPKDLTVTGERVLKLRLIWPKPAGDRKEESPDTPHLTPIAAPLLKQFEGQTAGVTYKGPPNDIDVTLTGPDAARFSYKTGRYAMSGPQGSELGNSISETAIFLGAIDSRIYKATLTFTPINGGNTVKITLFGQQQ